jgi:hypothetical protein
MGNIKIDWESIDLSHPAFTVDTYPEDTRLSPTK